MKTKLSLCATLIFVFSMNISSAQEDGAQGNGGSGGGLNSFFKGLGDAIGGIANAAGQGLNKGNTSNTKQDGAGADSQVIEILKLEASKDVRMKNCQGKHLQDVENRTVMGPFQRAEYGMAAAGAGLVAGEMSECAMDDQVNLTQWASRIGQLLAISAISAKKAGLGDAPQFSATAHRAIVLLNYAKQGNIIDADEMLNTLKKNGFKVAEEKISAKPSQETIALSASSAEVAKKYQDNQMAFHQKYTGKNIQVTGAVWAVIERSGNPSGANVLISGIKRKDPNTAPMSDWISCEITDSKGMSDAADLHRGKTITASGLYDPQLRSGGANETEVILHDCRIR